MASKNMEKGGTFNTVETGRERLAISLKPSSGGASQKTDVNTFSGSGKFDRTDSVIAKTLYASVARTHGPELLAKLSNYQSLFDLSQKQQLRRETEVRPAELVRDVPLLQTAPALSERSKRATEFRREHAPLAGRQRRRHDECRADRCAPRSSGSQANG